MTSALPPHVTVVIATLDRPYCLPSAVRSFLTTNFPCFDVVVVDQSEGDESERALAPWRGDSRLRHVRCRRRGAAIGRNAGAEMSTGELIAFIDDDCELGPEGLWGLVRAFEADRDIGVVFGAIRGAPHDPAAGFIVSHVPDRPTIARRVSDKRRVEGMAACMAVRRDAWIALAGFDEMFGPGSAFRAAEDMDLALRALLAGYAVSETPEASAIHYGFRSWGEAASQIDAYMYGIGAMMVKHLKCGHWKTWVLWADLAWRWAVSGPVIDLGRVPPRLSRLRAFLSGAFAALLTPVDRRRTRFLDRHPRQR